MPAVRLRIGFSDGRQEQRSLDEGSHTIGRESGDIVLGDPNVSGTHARIDVQGARVTITDLGSSNGTFDADGNRLTAAAALTPGRPVRLGGCTLELLSATKGQTVVLSASDIPPPPTETVAAEPTATAQPARQAEQHAAGDPQAGPRAQRVVNHSGSQPIARPASAPSKTTPELEFPNPLAYLGARYMALGGGAVLAGLAVLFSTSGSIEAIDRRSVTIGVLLLSTGATAFVAGLMRRLRVRLKRNEPERLEEARADNAAKLERMILERTIDGLSEREEAAQGPVARLLFDRVPDLAFMPRYVQFAMSNLVDATLTSIAVLLLFALSTFAIGGNTEGPVSVGTLALVAFAAITVVWPWNARGIRRGARVTLKDNFMSAVVGAIIVPPALLGLLPKDAIADLPTGYAFAALGMQVLLAAGIGIACARILLARLRRHGIEVGAAEIHQDLDAQLMPQHLVETLERLMKEYREGEIPNRTYLRVDPHDAANGVGASASDRRGNFQLALMQETQPIHLTGETRAAHEDPSVLLGVNLGTGLLAVGIIWATVAALFSSPESAFGILLAVAPPAMCLTAGYSVLAVATWTLQEVIFTSHLLYVRATGTFEGSEFRDVTTHVAPWIYTARLTTATLLRGTRANGPREVLSFEATPDVAQALGDAFEAELNSQSMRKAAKQQVLQNVSNAVGQSAAASMTEDATKSLVAGMVRRLPK